MIPYSYNMVDMGGIDLAEANGTVVDGLYNRLAIARNACGDLILYNWKFAEIEIAPGICNTLDEGTSILINGLIQVTEQDEVTVLGIAPPPPPIEPVEPLTVTQNGVYEAAPPYSGFNPVTVNVPSGADVVYVQYSPEYEQGAASGSRGYTYSANKTSSTTRIRPVDIVDVSQFLGDSVLFVWNDAIYDITIQQYTAGGILDITTTWYTSPTISNILQPNIVVVIRKKSQEAIIPSEFDSVQLKVISITDSSF